jgi:acetyl esterase/lipase
LAGANRLTKSSAVWATFCQPWSMVSECPRLGSFLISVTLRALPLVGGVGDRPAGLPPAFVIVDEADVLRDEADAARLRTAGVPVTTVRYNGITHDFMMLNPLSSTHATRAAVAQAIAILRDALHTA